MTVSAAAVFHDHGSVAVRAGKLVRAGTCASFSVGISPPLLLGFPHSRVLEQVTTSTQKLRVRVVLPFTVPLEAAEDGILEARVLLDSYLSAGHPLVSVVDLSKDLPPAPAPVPPSSIRTPTSTRTPSTATVVQDNEGEVNNDDSDDNDDNDNSDDIDPTAVRRAWTKCATCARKHWNDTACPRLAEPSADKSPASSDPHFFGEKRWGGATTTSMLEALKRRCGANPRGTEETREETDKDMTQEAMVAEVYRIVNAKVSQSRTETRRRLGLKTGYPEQVADKDVHM